jgi:hypothetical protein
MFNVKDSIFEFRCALDCLRRAFPVALANVNPQSISFFVDDEVRGQAYEEYLHIFFPVIFEELLQVRCLAMQNGHQVAAKWITTNFPL